MKKRPPIVTVMGHIDHGKTTLLDKIRQTNLAQKEQGGITQHIGAYQIEFQGEKITFIDTPGHVAFAKMRARGAKITDLVVLVIAADDGVMPQTRESLEHIKAAQVPFLVAINKMDLPGANSQKVKEQLKKEGVLLEGLGGDIVWVEISAKTGKGINELLEMILLLAEMEELKADPQAPFQGVVIESSLSKQKGPLASIIVKNGSLKLGDEIKTAECSAKVKAMFDENGHLVRLAEPSKPVEVLGFKKVPQVGSLVVSAEEELLTTEKRLPSEDKKSQEEKEKKLKLIFKSDTQGTLEAILSNLPQQVNVVLADVGDVNESDIFLAETTQAAIIAFNVKISGAIKKLAKREGVKIFSYTVIYDLLDKIKNQLIKEEKPEEILGEAEILAEFQIKGERIAGCRVKKGEINKRDSLYLKRGEKVIGKTKIKSMQTKKETVDQVREGQEFGIVFTPALDFKIGDVIIAYRIKNNGTES